MILRRIKLLVTASLDAVVALHASKQKVKHAVVLVVVRRRLQQLQEDSAEFHEVFKLALDTESANQQEPATDSPDALYQKLVHLADTDWPLSEQAPEAGLTGDNNSGGFSLTVFLVPGVSPRIFFSRLITPDADPPPESEGGFKNTVFGLIEA